MFEFFKGNNNQSKSNESKKSELEYSDKPITMNLSKENSLIQLDLRKEKVDSICNAISNLQNMRAKIALVLDFSGSMGNNV